jgi:group I intron endonuclease
MMIIGIYKITNIINGKVYIGQSINIKKRWNQEKHGRGINNHLNSSFNKYGIGNFTFEILKVIEYYTPSLQSILNDYEDFYIKEYNSTDNRYGYNKQQGGRVGFTITEETRLKASLAQKGKKQSQETINKRKETRKNNTGFKHSEETKKKISKSHQGIKPNKETRELMSKNRLGKEKAKDSSWFNHLRPVICIETGMVYKSVAEAQRVTGIRSIYNYVNNTRKPKNGYHWEYYIHPVGINF